MFSKSFMKFLISYDGLEPEDQEKKEQKEIEFKSTKVNEAAKVVISTIKESY